MTTHTVPGTRLRTLADIDPETWVADTADIERKIRDRIEAARPKPPIEELRQQALDVYGMLFARVPKAAYQRALNRLGAGSDTI